jgi:hypothetical protein
MEDLNSGGKRRLSSEVKQAVRDAKYDVTKELVKSSMTLVRVLSYVIWFALLIWLFPIVVRWLL